VECFFHKEAKQDRSHRTFWDKNCQDFTILPLDPRRNPNHPNEVNPDLAKHVGSMADDLHSMFQKFGLEI